MSRLPCGEPAAPPDWSPLPDAVCREVRREWTMRRAMHFAIDALCWLIIAATLALLAVIVVSGAGNV